MSKPTKANPFDFDISGWPQLPKLSGLLVVGTSLGVGKTLIAGAIARQLRKADLCPEVFMPVVTGCRLAREGLISPAAEFLAACADSHRTLTEIAPIRYAPAIAPNVAAERANRPIDLEVMFDAYRSLSGKGHSVVVEAPGGLCSPLTDSFWTVHLAMMINLPVVLVAPAGLGAINQTLLTLHAARAAGLTVAGVIINRYRIDPMAEKVLAGHDKSYTHGDHDLAVFTNPPEISERGRIEVLAVVPEDGESSVENATLGFDVEFAVSQVDWSRIINAK